MLASASGIVSASDAGISFTVSASSSAFLDLNKRPITLVFFLRGAGSLPAGLRRADRLSATTGAGSKTGAVNDGDSIAIAGAVKLPQIYPTLGKTTLLDAISQAGGLVEDAGNTAIVVRGDTADRAFASQTSGENPAGGEPPNPRTVKVDLKRLMETGDPSLNLALYPGDRVTVQRAGVVYVVGAVNLAGGFVLTSDRAQMTVLRAIALAQNVKSTAAPEKAMIVRKSPNTLDGSQQIPLDLRKILKGRGPDQKLLADDILVVPDSAGRKALHRAAEAAAQASSLVIYRVP